jgi:hypothetical protein
MKPLLARKASWLFIATSAFAMPPALLAFIVSFVKPKIATQTLYGLSGLGWRIGAACLFVSILLAFGLNFTVARVVRARRQLRAALNHYRGWWRAGKIVLATMLVSCFIPDFRSVRFAGGLWISAKWGQITESTARQYLWGAVRFSSFFVFASAFNLCLFSLCVRDAMHAVQQHGAD